MHHVLYPFPDKPRGGTLDLWVSTCKVPPRQVQQHRQTKGYADPYARVQPVLYPMNQWGKGRGSPLLPYHWSLSSGLQTFAYIRWHLQFASTEVGHIWQPRPILQEGNWSWSQLLTHPMWSEGLDYPRIDLVQSASTTKSPRYYWDSPCKSALAS